MEFWIYNGQVVTGKGVGHSAILVSGRKIKKIISDTEFRNEILPSLDRTDSFDAGGKLVFAGGIDAHVHFREPGMTRKADMESESKAAVLGGVTSFIDMPNTRPATTSAACLAEKLASADGRLHANYGFHLGATNDNYGEIDRILQEGKDGICSKDFGGIKVFMGSSTGNMLVDDDNVLDSLFSTDRKEILVHCEDENTIRKNLADAENAFGEDIPFSFDKRGSGNGQDRQTLQPPDYGRNFGQLPVVLRQGLCKTRKQDKMQPFNQDRRGQKGTETGRQGRYDRYCRVRPCPSSP